MVRLSIAAAFATAAAITAQAQTFNVLASFSGTNGAQPLYMSLAQGVDGNFYGTGELIGLNGGGIVFKVSPQGALSTVHNFCSLSRCGDGDNPAAGVILATDGNLYG